MRVEAEAERCATVALTTYRRYRRVFRTITQRARRRFVDRDWVGMGRDVLERIDLYTGAISLLTRVVRRRLADRVEDQVLWADIKDAYDEKIAPLPDANIARTFFNSLTRKVFSTVGVHPLIEFVTTERLPPVAAGSGVVQLVASGEGNVEALVHRTLDATPLGGLFHDRAATVRLIAAEIEKAGRRAWGHQPIDRIELVDAMFCRGFGAYLIGRFWAGRTFLPLALSFMSLRRGVVIDAVLTDEDDVSIVFSFTRSYFLVDTDSPHEVVEFLRAIVPRKPVAELYTALGYNKHGKTVLYHDLMRHLASATDHFVPAPGERGMVMIVFTIPSYSVVFKVIRDRFAHPKTTTRDDVQDRYRFVFRRDRAGRLADAQEFEHLTLDRGLFSDELLEELTRDAARTVHLKRGAVTLDHVYTERRMTPLNLFLRGADPGRAREAVLDYGQALRDLAASNIFPGDLLLKNFGVTRHGRVVFYDYDELALLTDCNFRDLPVARSDEDEMRGEAWFYVGPNDIFPAEFRSFAGFSGDLMAVFEEAHGELFEGAWWRRMQAVHRDGLDTKIFAYPRTRRLRGAGASLPDGGDDAP